MNRELFTLKLLNDLDPQPCCLFNEGGRSAFVLVSEHAGHRVPLGLENLGLSEDDLLDHIGWDLYIRDVGERLSALLDAPYFAQEYSRLVIDCNRPPGAPQSILAISDNRRVPGNEGLSAADIAAREREIFHPFHSAVAACLDARAARGQSSILVTLHSFTPAMRSGDDGRPWQITFQYGRDPSLSKKLIAIASRDPKICVGDNVPYPVHDDTHYGIPVHGEKRGLPHTMIEIRQDVIASEKGKALWAQKLQKLLTDVSREILSAE
jgi:predicted N-formylglutamate amidohydrolase